MSDYPTDYPLLHSLSNCLREALLVEPGYQIICDGFGADCADITLEVNGQGFVATIEPCIVNSREPWLHGSA